MHVRVTHSKRGSKRYRSVQLAQTYRSDEGKPVTKVIASLGSLSDLEIQNLRQTVAASRAGQAVVVAASQPASPKVKRSLAYLDVATCYRLWCDWGLSQLIDQRSTSSRHEVSIGEVVAALTVQRCVAPASKLEASRWYPTTALPELQDISPGQFNNSRVHRALDALAVTEDALQEHLAEHIAASQGQFVSLFLDCTDTWFVGHGPRLAATGLTKEGLYRRKIGIALLCNEHGFPLRWKTVEGNQSEVRTMLDMVDATAKLAWAQKLPLVVDRAMGRGVTIEGLLARDVRFVTAVPAPEIAGYSARIPLGAFDHVPLEESQRDDERVLNQLRKAACDVGFQKSGARYLLDLGVIAKGEGGDEVSASWLVPSRAVALLQAATAIRHELDGGSSLVDLAQRHDCTDRTFRQWLVVLNLTGEVQQCILDGDADNLQPEVLYRIAQLPESQQLAAFETARTEHKGDGPLAANNKLARFLRTPAVRLRAVALFNPSRLIEQRQAACREVAEIEQLVATLNEGLCSSRRAKPAKALERLTYALRKNGLVDIFDASVQEADVGGKQLPQLQLRRDEDAWSRRRRTDGITLIVAHPDVLAGTSELATLYFAKDMVEKDFQSIKSVLAMRPVNHQTDPKVRAHVTLCMLGLLLQRTLEQRLRQTGLDLTGHAALATLDTARLNLFAGRGKIYSVTEPDPDQQRILTALKLKDLVNDTHLAAILRPR